LSKPIDRIKLDASLDRLLPSTVAAAPMPAAAAQNGTPQQTPPSQRPVDWEALLNSIDGDENFARDLADAFIGMCDRELSTISTALSAGDAATLRISAHTLKGASANLRASATAAAAADLESAAGSGMSAQVPFLAQNLMTEVNRTIAYLKSGSR
jgi:two-component system, sensor histidine kinase and response regulator